MKFLFLIAALAMIACSQALTDAQREKISEDSKACIIKTGANIDLIKRFKGGDYEFDDAQTKLFVFCLMNKSGVMNEQGNFFKDVALSKVEEKKRDRVGKAIDLCLDKVGPTPAETAWNYAKCYHLAKTGHSFI